ncbi:DNA-binding protein [Elizabethkingia anophelis]|nr:DNA-binding protein [Elizabethkingia anophelis]
MSDYKERQENEIFTKVLKAGRRTYFFDGRETKAGDYYLTITESKKNFSENGEASFEKHKIYLYKEDFKSFSELFNESTNFILDEKGEEVISERHNKDYKTTTNSFTIDTDEEL